MQRIWALVSGDPPDFVHVPDDDEGVYALAGGPGEDGNLPYWWMTWTKAAALRHLVVTPRTLRGAPDGERPPRRT